MAGLEIWDSQGRSLVSTADRIGSFVGQFHIPGSTRADMSGQIMHPAFETGTPFLHSSGQVWSAKLNSYKNAPYYGMYPFTYTLTKIPGGVSWYAQYRFTPNRANYNNLAAVQGHDLVVYVGVY